MEGELKFNFVLSESRRNGHDENVNHWRFFFSGFLFFYFYWSKSAFSSQYLLLLTPSCMFLSLPVYFMEEVGSTKSAKRQTKALS